MKDFIDTLNNQPEIGMLSSVGSGALYWMDILNPILSFLTLLVGLLIGLITLGIKIKQWRKI
tara:strand:- start:222 stop:407 length:186 start_codon:yes stop_codon:yes gene_type:complete